MLKKIIILLACILPGLSQAQTIHWLTFIDTTDKNVGQMDQNGREVLYNHFINVVNAALSEKGFKSNIQDIYGSTLTPQKCKEIVTNLKCGPDDIVVFYYIGHGTHGTVGGDAWPMMLMAQHSADYLVPLKWVHDQLKSKGAKLTASIGMCCNVYQGVNRKDSPSFAVNYGNATLTDTEIKSIQRMFLENKGDFLVTSASPGQSSYGNMTSLGPMDFFTFFLVKIFEDAAYEGTLNWEKLFGEVRDTLDEFSAGDQTPVFLSNLSQATPAPTPAPVISPVEVPTPSSSESSVNGSQDILNRLGLALDNLIDLRQSDSKRIDQAMELEKIFSNNAVVKVMSQDGNVVVDKSSANSFIGRLATSRILLKVVPVNMVINNGKISELKVKEVYKK